MTALDYYPNLTALLEMWTIYHWEVHTVMLKLSDGVNGKWTKKLLSQSLTVPSLTRRACQHHTKFLAIHTSPCTRQHQQLGESIEFLANKPSSTSGAYLTKARDVSDDHVSLSLRPCGLPLSWPVWVRTTSAEQRAESDSESRGKGMNKPWNTSEHHVTEVS